jgi:hypothetical protein
MMKCGHTPNAKDVHGNPVCVICIGINPLAEEIDTSPPSLEGRIARCNTCGSQRESAYNLPFFQKLDTKNIDTFYCGCYGWD